MFAGHVGVALAVGRAERRINVGILMLAALLLDVILWLFVLLGWESVAIPADFARTHQAEFAFPYSHGLLAGMAWSVLAGAIVFAAMPRRDAHRLRAAALVGAGVLSHWLLDALVHVAELPLAGPGSMKVGLGLWQHMAPALGVETLIVAAGLWLFVPGAGLSRAKAVSLTILTLVTLGVTIAGMTIAPPPPSAMAMAASSLATIALLCILAGWLGKAPREKSG
ncbi:MAG: hypothetical protein ABI790_08675 [Betaproteobacteria bacterium]